MIDLVTGVSATGAASAILLECYMSIVDTSSRGDIVKGDHDFYGPLGNTTI